MPMTSLRIGTENLRIEHAHVNWEWGLERDLISGAFKVGMLLPITWNSRGRRTGVWASHQGLCATRMPGFPMRALVGLPPGLNFTSLPALMP